MLKFIAAVGRHRDWTDGEWQRHYHDHHGPLVASTSGFTSETLGYRQNYVEPLALAGVAPVPERIRGITELWYDDFSAMDRAFSAPDYLRHIRPDEGRFADATIAIIGMGRETVIRESLVRQDDKRWGAQPLFHLFLFQFTNDPLDDEAPGALRHTRMVVDPAAGLFPAAHAFVAVDEFWFDDREQANAFSEATVRNQSEPPLLFLTRAHIVFDRRLLQP